MMRKKVLFIYLGIGAFVAVFLFIWMVVYDSYFHLLFTPSGYQNNKIFDVLIEDIDSESFENNIIDFQNKTKKCKTFPTKASYIKCQGLFYSEYKHYDWGDDYRAECYLECYYSSIEFKKDIDRLEEFENRGKKAIFVEDLFSLPAYVAAYNWDSNYEYSLIDEENYIIRYVYLFDTGKNIDFPEIFFPKKLLRESNFPNQGFANGYSCYVS
jgi:hypothetical protein